MPDDESLVAVIDDDEAICRAVSRVLEAAGHRVRSFTSAREYLEAVHVDAPTCVVVDIPMPDLDGLAVIRALHANGDDVATIAMTATSHIPTVVEALKEGAVDLLAKPFTASELHAAIERATDAVRRGQADRRALLELWRATAALTSREAEVCALVAHGLLNKQVAALIGTTEKTVKVHRGRAMKKLQVTSVAGLVRLVDGLLAGAHRAVIRVDGAELARPAAAAIITDVIMRAREQASPPPAGPSMDHRTIPHPV